MTDYDRLVTLVDRIVDGGHLDPSVERVDGLWSGVQGACHVAAGELTATRTSCDGATVHSLAFAEGGDVSTIAADSRTGDFGANIGHDGWGDDGAAFLEWAEAL